MHCVTQSLHLLYSEIVSDKLSIGFQSDFTAFLQKCLFKKGIICEGHDPNFAVGCYDEGTISVVVEVCLGIIVIP